MYINFYPFFTVTTRKLWRTKLKLFQPPNRYYVATLPSETNTDAVLMSQLRHFFVFVYNLLHFNAFNHLHRLLWAE